jgi:hypothetical protein
MRLEFTDYDVWSFSKDDAGFWRWCRRSPEGTPLIEAHTPQQTLEECQDDARRHGYAAGTLAF